MAGADLEVSVIRRRVRSGVFLAVGLSLLVVVVAGALVRYTERRLLGAVRSTTHALVAIAAGDGRAVLPLQRGYPAEVAGMNQKANQWIAVHRRELSRREGSSRTGSARKDRSTPGPYLRGRRGTAAPFPGPIERRIASRN